jgi:hypothetical protein
MSGRLSGNATTRPSDRRQRGEDNFRIADQPPTKRYSGSACNNLCCFPMGRIDGEDLPRWHLSLLQGTPTANRSNRSLSRPLCFDNAPGVLDADQALALERPYIERDYLWRITIDIRSSSVVRSVGEDQVRNRYEAVIAE